MSVANSAPVITDYTWNTQLEALLKDIGEAAIVYKWVYNRLAMRYNRRYYIFGVGLIAVNTLLGVAMIIAGAFENVEGKIIGIVSGISSLILAMLGSLNTLLNYAETSANCREASTDFSKLNHDIDTELRTKRKHRQNAHTYMIFITREYDRLLKSSPEMSPDTLNEYKKTFPNSKIRAPDAFDDLHEIVIAEEQEKTIDGATISKATVPQSIANATVAALSAPVTRTKTNSGLTKQIENAVRRTDSGSNSNPGNGSGSIKRANSGDGNTRDLPDNIQLPTIDSSDRSDYHRLSRLKVSRENYEMARSNQFLQQ